MKKTNYIFFGQIAKLVICLFLLNSCDIIDKIGGNFSGKPEEIELNISDGAKALMEKAYADTKNIELHDHHVHIIALGVGEEAYINPELLSWENPVNRLKTEVYMDASGVSKISKIDKQYVKRLATLVRSNKYPGKFHILAFDYNYNADGTKNKEDSPFYVSNEYVYETYKKYPDIFVPVISVHPYRPDAVKELEKWAKKDVKWVKWLPNVQNIDPSDARIDNFYKVMKKYNMILLTHTGDEEALPGKKHQDFGNPLLYKRPLDIGVKVVMAHCASLGKNDDLAHRGKKMNNFDFFIRMMNNPKYKGLLYGEISAITQVNRPIKIILYLLERDDFKGRLINGSDYPLPAVNIVISLKKLVDYKLISKQEGEYLKEIYQYNPLIFDYVLKRTLHHPKTGKKFDASVFGKLEE